MERIETEEERERRILQRLDPHPDPSWEAVETALRQFRTPNFRPEKDPEVREQEARERVGEQIISRLVSGTARNVTVPSASILTGAGKGRPGEWRLKRQFKEAAETCASCGGWLHAFGRVEPAKATEKQPRPHMPTMCLSCQADDPYVEPFVKVTIEGRTHAAGGGKIVDVGTHVSPRVVLPDASKIVKTSTGKSVYVPADPRTENVFFENVRSGFCIPKEEDPPEKEKKPRAPKAPKSEEEIKAREAERIAREKRDAKRAEAAIANEGRFKAAKQQIHAVAAEVLPDLRIKVGDEIKIVSGAERLKQAEARAKQAAVVKVGDRPVANGSIKGIVPLSDLERMKLDKAERRKIDARPAKATALCDARNAPPRVIYSF